MKSDWRDSRNYPPRTPKRKKNLTALLIPLVVFAGVAKFTPDFIQWMMDKGSNAVKQTYPPSAQIADFHPKTETHPRPAMASPAPSAPVIRPPSANEVNGQGKQVVFNDQNYQPRGADNVLAFTPVAQAEERIRDSGRSYPRTQTIKNHVTPWHWEHADRTRAYGNFHWTEINGRIDYSTVCKNYKYGSIIYRDCRKGAKKSFKQMCQQGSSAACHAENNYLP